MKNKKIYYLPGLITLSFLLIICTIWLNNNKIINQRLLEFGYLDKEMQNEIPCRIFKPLRLNDSDDLVLIKSAINKLILSKDTVFGLDITISDSCKYLNYVSLLDYFLREKYDYYYPFDSHIKVIYSINKSDKVSQIFERRIPDGYIHIDFTQIDDRNILIRFCEKIKDYWSLDYHLRIVSILLFSFIVFAIVININNNWR